MLRHDIKLLVIRPALKALDLLSEGAEMLVYGTGFVETGYNHLKQIGGPALGLYQIEPETHKFIKGWLKRPERVQLLEKVLGACSRGVLPDDDALVWDLYYATMMCRIRYLNAVQSLPFWNDSLGMALYHSQHYNRGGKANVEHNTAMFDILIKEERDAQS